MKHAAAAQVADQVVSGNSVGKTFANGTVVALDNANFSVRKGSFVSLVGPSGCGKSTLLRLISGLIEPTSGSLHVHGTEVASPRTDVAMMFQRATLLEWRTAIENVLLPETLAEHHQRLQTAGFNSADVWFQCFNFASLVAVK